MRLPEISIKRPVFMTMVALALIVFGIVSFPRLALDLFPKIDFPVVNITTKLVGASPEVMEVDVTDVIEEAVNTISGVKTITSRSMEEFSIVTVEFYLERNVEQAAQDVRDKVAAVRNRLPRDTEPPVIEKISPEDQPIIWIAVWGDRTVKDLTHYADKVLKRDIEKIPGVGSVTMSGGRTRQVRIWLDRAKMEAQALTASDVKQALGAEQGRIELDPGVHAQIREQVARDALDLRRRTAMHGRQRDVIGDLVRDLDVAHRRIDLRHRVDGGGKRMARVAHRGDEVLHPRVLDAFEVIADAHGEMRARRLQPHPVGECVHEHPGIEIFRKRLLELQFLRPLAVIGLVGGVDARPADGDLVEDLDGLQFDDAGAA